MVDPNDFRGRRAVFGPIEIQIPLWSIPTDEKERSDFEQINSDSSMVDPNYYSEPGEGTVGDAIQIPLWSIPTENLTLTTPEPLIIQIPLWSIPTYGYLTDLTHMLAFRFLYGRSQLGRLIRTKADRGIDSDSSMVDPNSRNCGNWRRRQRIQIPLWSIPTA